MAWGRDREGPESYGVLWGLAVMEASEGGHKGQSISGLWGIPAEEHF